MPNVSGVLGRSSPRLVVGISHIDYPIRHVPVVWRVLDSTYHDKKKGVIVRPITII